MIEQDQIAEVDRLLRQIQRQDALALQKLYDLIGAKLLGLILRIVNDSHHAEDVLQDVFVKIWQQADRYTATGSAWGWICVMSRHSAIDRLRSLKTRAHESTDELPHILQTLCDDNQQSDDIDRRWIGQCLAALKSQPREAIILSYVNGYSHGELSRKMDVPLGTVKAWIRRGLQELKQCLVA